MFWKVIKKFSEIFHSVRQSSENYREIFASFRKIFQKWSKLANFDFFFTKNKKFRKSLEKIGKFEKVGIFVVVVLT